MITNFSKIIFLNLIKNNCFWENMFVKIEFTTNYTKSENTSNSPNTINIQNSTHLSFQKNEYSLSHFSREIRMIYALDSTLSTALKSVPRLVSS